MTLEEAVALLHGKAPQKSRGAEMRAYELPWFDPEEEAEARLEAAR